MGIAAWAGNVAMAEAVLSRGAEMEMKNDIGTTPLWLAAGEGVNRSGMGKERIGESFFDILVYFRIWAC